MVVRNQDGSVIRSTLQWPVASTPMSLPPLPADLQVWNEATQEYFKVDFANTKAVFFVRTHAGHSTWHDHMRFFSDAVPVRNLWVRVRLTDGEVLEGRTVNDMNLLTDPGFWLWPTDAFSNNLLVYIPKSAVSEFHIMGLETARLEKSIEHHDASVEQDDVLIEV